MRDCSISLVELQVSEVRSSNKLMWHRLLFLCVQTLPSFSSTFSLIHPSSRLGSAPFPNAALSNPAKLLISSSHSFFLLFYHPFDICTEGAKWSHLSVCHTERSLAGEGEKAAWEEGHLKVRFGVAAHSSTLKLCFRSKDHIDQYITTHIITSFLQRFIYIWD